MDGLPTTRYLKAATFMLFAYSGAALWVSTFLGLGYFLGDRFVCIDKPEDITDEIALNPAGFADRTSMQTMSTLVHEMVHLWQHHFGKTSRAGYHNREWAAKMHEVGLIPTDTGDLGGKETGQKVTHIIEDGGRFQKACDEWLTSHAAFLYHDRAGDG